MMDMAENVGWDEKYFKAALSARLSTIERQADY